MARAALLASLLLALGCSSESLNQPVYVTGDGGEQVQLELGQSCNGAYACAPLGEMRPEGVMGEPACEGAAADSGAAWCTILCDHQLPSPDEACQELAVRIGETQGKCLEGRPGVRVCHFR